MSERTSLNIGEVLRSEDYYSAGFLQAIEKIEENGREGRREMRIKFESEVITYVIPHVTQ